MAETPVPSAVEKTRAQLADTLDELEDKFNVKKQTSALVERTRTSYEQNPIPWIVGATAAVIVVAGLVAWAIFSGDDD